MDQGVMHFVDTLLCTDINAPVTGQLALDLMLNPPSPGDPSYNTFVHVRAKPKPQQQLVFFIFLYSYIG